jgi:hypothetical protein
MAENDKGIATDEAGALPVAQGAGDSAVTKQEPREFLKAARRGLSEQELSSPPAIRWMISELERLDGECSELRKLSNLYNDQRVEIAILKSDRSVSRKSEILSYVCSTIGAAMLGAGPSYLAVQGTENIGKIIVGLSIVLIVGGISTSRIFK